MKIEEVKEKLRAQGYLDEREICGYAQFPVDNRRCDRRGGESDPALPARRNADGVSR